VGLSITAYSHLNAVGKHYDGDWCEEDGHVAAFAYDSFPQSFVGIPVVEIEQGRDERFFVGGCYAVTEETKTHDFRAGSYGSYNRWRQALQDKYNPGRLENEPFYELIWFADNEGTISSLAAIHLLADFEAHADGFEELGEPFSNFYKAAQLASQDGLIEFR
jgi:hypothetical protein